MEHYDTVTNIFLQWSVLHMFESVGCDLLGPHHKKVCVHQINFQYGWTGPWNM